MQADKVLKCELDYTLDVGDRVHVEDLPARQTQSCRSLASVF